MIRQSQAQPNALSRGEIQTISKAYALEVLYYDWPQLELISERQNLVLLGSIFVVFPHYRQEVLAPISIQLNDLYLRALETEAKAWGLKVYIENNNVYVRKTKSKPSFMKQWDACERRGAPPYDEGSS